MSRRTWAIIIAALTAGIAGGTLTGSLIMLVHTQVDTFWSSRGPWQVPILGAGLLLAFILNSFIVPPRRRR